MIHVADDDDADQRARSCDLRFRRYRVSGDVSIHDVYSQKGGETILESWPGLSRPSVSFLPKVPRKTWMPQQGAGMTVERCFELIGTRSR
jgi:hypothetical protein